MYKWHGYKKEHFIIEELSWWEWLKGLERFRPYHLEFSGGEPLLYKDFKTLIAHIPRDSTWAITSNSLLDVSGIDMEKCICWTASYHWKNEDKFLDNMKRLNWSGIRPKISIVVEKNKFDECIEKAWFFKHKGFGVNLLRELNEGVNWEGSKEWEKLIELRSAGFNVVEEDIPAKYEFSRGYICDAGKTYFAVMPDGKVYTCYSAAMCGESIGNIFDVIPKIDSFECFHECMACAMDYKFRIKKIEKVFA